MAKINNTKDILIELEQVLIARKSADGNTSYVASLYDGGIDVILKKIAEESAELLMATKDKDNKQIVYEMADLWFHNLVLLANENISVNEVLRELDRRFGLSGIVEKNNRKK